MKVKKTSTKIENAPPSPDQRTKLIKQNGHREFIIAFVFRVSAACLPGNWALILRVRKGLKQLMWSVQTTSNILASFCMMSPFTPYSNLSLTI